jgi:hypothetical protein
VIRAQAGEKRNYPVIREWASGLRSQFTR